MRKTNFLVLICMLFFSWQLSAQTLSEGFEGATFPPTGWDTITNGNGAGFNWTTSATAATGSNAAFVRYENVTGVAEDWLVTPLTAITAADSLVFSHAQSFGSNFGSIYSIRVATTSQRDTANFTTIKSYTENDFGTSYSNDTISLAAYAGQSIYIAFVLTNDDGDSWFVDDVQIGFPNCFVPSALTASSITTSSASLDWTENGTAPEWQIEWDTAGFTQGTGTLVIDNSAANPVTISGLTAQTSYQWYVRAICGPGDTSAWSVVNSFATPCNAFTAPFTEDFSTFVPACWNEADDGTLATGPISLGSGEWTLTNGAAEINLYDIGTEDWLVSPIIDFGAGGYELAIDARVYAYNSPGTPSAMGSDDTVYVAISTDNGATWTSVYSWNAGNTPTNVLTTYRIDLTAYTGSNNIIGFYASEGSVDDSEDFDIELDNFELRIPPACPTPIANAASNITTTSALVSWVAGGTETQWQVEYDVAGFTQGSGNLMLVNVDTFLMVSGLMAATSYDWYVRGICGAGDTSAFVAGAAFQTSFQAPLGVNCTVGNPTVVFSEEFDNNNAGWTGSLGSAGNNWEIPDGSGSGSTGADNAHSGANYMNFEATGATLAGGAVVSPAIDLSAGIGDAELSFWLHAYGIEMGDLNVGVGTSATGPFTTVFTSVGQVQTSGADAWSNIGVNLSAYLGQTIYIEFNLSNVTGYRSDMSIDLMEVTTCASCATPTANMASGVNSTDATLSWVENGTATSWQVEYDVAGFTQGAGNLAIVNTDTFTTVTGLTPNTAYDWYVRAICGAGDSSAWTGVGSFTTPAQAITAPYSQDFEGTTPLADFSTMIGSDANLVLDANSNCAATNSLHMTGGSSVGWSGSSGLTGTSVTQAWVTNTTKQSSASLNVDATTLMAAGLELSFDLKQEWSYGPGYSWARILVDGVQISPDYRPATQNADPCANYIIDLAPYLGTSFELTFQFAGKYDDPQGNVGQGDNAFFDNIQLIPVTCPDPTNLSATSITATDADLTWTENGTATTWNVEYDLQGFTPGTGTTVVATATTQNVTGLSTYTTYDFYVQADCGADSSRVVGPFSFTTGAPLAGQYTIDSTQATSATNFESFSAFGTAINAWGVSAAVDVSVAANTYNDQLSLGEITGTSNLNFITIDGNGAATLTHDKSIRNSTITIEGTSWLTIKNMTIAATGGADSWGIHMLDSAHHIAIDSNVIQLPVGTTTDVAGIISSNAEDSDVGSGSNAYDVTISNNSITGGENGMSMRGDFTATNRNANITITNNVMTDNDDIGIYIAGWDNVVITGNTVNTPNNSGSDAFYSSDLENFDISGNYFSGNDFGMDMDDSNFDNDVSTYSTISNNMVIGGDDALSLDDVDSVNVFHNSLYAADWALILNDDSNLDIRNNIFYSVDDHALNSDDGNVHVMDNNIFFTGGTADLVEFGTSNYTDLAAFVTGEPSMNGSSLQGDPTFANNGVDLHIVGSLPNDVGDNTVGITVDFDGDTRPLAPSTTVDIGADEFAPPACPIPTANAATNVASDSADVSWVENGTTTQWEVQYGTAGFTAGNGTSMIVMTDTFTTISGLSSATAYDWYVRAICGPNDTSAWANVSSFSTTCPAPSVAVTLPFIEGWEMNSGTLTGVTSLTNIVCANSYAWDFISNNAQGRALYGNNAFQTNGGLGAVTLDVDPSGTVVKNDLYLTLNMSSYTTDTDLELLFDYAHNGEEVHVNDSVWMRGSDSDPWVGVFDLFANQAAVDVYQTVGPFDVDAILAAASQTVSASFQVRFGQEDNFPSGSGDGYSFDNIVVRQTPSCFAPVALATNVITTTSADFSWNDTNTVTAPEYQYSYGSTNFIAGTGTQAIVSTDSVTVSGLMGTTNYDWYVRAICGPGDTSLWSIAASFQTLCIPAIAPVTESFDGTTIPACWSQSATLDGPWVFGTPGFGWNTQGCLGVPTDVTGNSGNYAALDFSGSGVVDVVLEMNDVDVSGLTNPYLDFYFYMCGLTYTPINILYVEAFDGTNWNLVDSIQEHTNGWKRYGFDISGAVYSTNLVKIRFRASSAGNTVTMFRGDQAIDDVTIGDAPAVELRALEVIRPLSGCGLSTTDSVEFTFVNVGSAAQSNFDVVYAVNGVAITPETFTGTIQPGDTMGFTFQTSVDLSAAGVYSITAYTAAMNDFNTTNDSAFTSVISTASSSVFPYAESFESGAGGWLVAGTANWELGAPAGVFINTASDGTQAWMTDLDANYPDNGLGYVISPCFDFSNVDYPYISMDIWYDIESNWDGSVLEASIDGGLTWSVIGEEDDDINWYNDSANSMVSNNIAADGRAWTGNGSVSGVPGTNGWINAQHELYDLAGEPKVQLRMTFASDGNTNDDGMAFDNVRIIDSVRYAPIGDINQTTPAGTADSDGEIYFTSGIVMGIDLDGNAGHIFTIIDMASGSQEGIGVFSSVDVGGYVVTQGDSIMIRGEVTQFNGLTQLSNIDSIAIIATNVTEPTPIEVNFPSEGTESKWIKINNVHSLEVSTTAGNNDNHDFTRGSDTLTMRVDRDTDVDDSLGVYPIAIGDSLCSITGIGGQFSFSAGLDDGYQIGVHRYADMDTTACGFIVGLNPVVEEEFTFSLSPNPSNGEFVIRTAGFKNPSVRITIRDISGRIASEELINNANNALQKSIDLSNNAKGVYFISIQDGDNVINKKLILQ